MQQSLALFFIIVTGKVYALSLMHTINSRQAMRERFKSHDLGRTSLSQFQWSQPQTLVGSDGLSTPEVGDPFPIGGTSPASRFSFGRVCSRTRLRSAQDLVGKYHSYVARRAVRPATTSKRFHRLRSSVKVAGSLFRGYPHLPALISSYIT